MGKEMLLRLKKRNELRLATLREKVEATTLSEEELNAKIEKGYTDILEGKTKPAKQAFDEMRKDFNL